MRFVAFIFATLLIATTAMAASTKIKCVADLPANNSFGLPASWSIELDTDEDSAKVSYSGGPKEAADAGVVTPNVVATEEFSGGWDIAEFGHKVQDHDLRILLSFKEEGFKGGEMRFRAKMDRFKKGVKLLDVATAFCHTL